MSGAGGGEPRPRDEVAAVLAAVVVHSPTLVSVAGQRVAVSAGGEAAAGAPAGGAVSPAVAALGDQLYAAAYCRRIDAPPAPQPTATENPAFRAALSAANSGRERWDGGWRIEQVEPTGAVTAVKNGLGRRFAAGQYVSHDGPGAPPQPGGWVSAFFARESFRFQPGFYFAFGEAPADLEPGSGPLRFYWNLAAVGAAPWVAATTSLLNRWQVPFQLKVLDRPGLFGRRDAGVLFLDRRYQALGAPLIERLGEAVADHLLDDVPLFARRLAPGVAYAEDPGTGESFGQERCRLVAEAVWAAWRRGEQGVAARVRELDRLFEERGLSLSRPWLAARSAPRYPLPWQEGR